jgi:hypothetical protein
MERDMDMALTNIIMESSMLATSIRINSMDRELRLFLMEIDMMDSGTWVKRKVMASTFMLMNHYLNIMKGFITITRRMEREFIIIKVARRRRWSIRMMYN